MSAKNEGIVEFIRITKDDAERLEKDILIRRHIERYAIVRQFVYGTLVDCACGVGYGTHLMAKNPDVTRAIGVDITPECIETATREFSSPKVSYVQGDINTVEVGKADFLVSLETIEHLPDPAALARFADRLNVQEAIVSYPIKKTTHYNKHHLWDIIEQDIVDLFDNFVVFNKFDYTFDTRFIHLVRRTRNVVAPVRLKR
jgi:2-polyprenyl-3-methyl-5-hydroxy-6-metoxy-1,4-benzoquinol methylase